ncbi:MAG: permease, partial [Verrucomicrobia bacterium]|nr:permease [Verrucomicrobiota bacterium]
MNKELKIAGCMVGVFVLAYWLPLLNAKVSGAILEAFKLLQWYARNHTLACVVPALFIAGGIITFLSEATVMRYLGPKSNKPLAYGVAAVSGAVLAVCSCSVLPMFVGIYQLGAGLGPASAFLYSGPAINVLAIFLTARVLGFEIGVWRAVGSIVFAVVIGLLMALVFRREDTQRANEGMLLPEPETPHRPLWKNTVLLACMVGFLVFSDWFNPGDVVVRTREGTTFAAVTLQEMKDEVMFQLKEPWQGQSEGAKVTLPKTSLAQVEEAQTWVMAIYHARWYLAG